MDPAKQPPAINEKDEALIKEGIARSGTETRHSSESEKSHTEQDAEDSKIPIDGSHFTPTRTFYILRHNLFSKEINVIDISDEITHRYTGGDLTDSLRDSARSLTEDKERCSKPVYQLKRPHWYRSGSVMTAPDSSSPSEEIANWKHCSMSFGKATLSFPPDSKVCSHDIVMAPVKWYRRTNEWVQDSVSYQWRCDSKLKANRMTLLKCIGDRQVVIGRYAQRWGSWITGGVLLVDTHEIDERVAVLSTCVMLRRMQQRAAERTKYTGGGGGGGGGE